MPILHQILIVALLAAFIVLFLNKTGMRTKLRDWNDKIGISLTADMLDCDFCLSFWTCFCVVMAFLLLGFEISMLVPFCATPITRYLL